MTEIDTTFFSGKRPWSKIKDKVLSEYMPAYLRKVATLGKDILLIDGYAGPGEFDDNTHGSPLIMCEAAEKHVRERYTALFVNHNPAHHEKLDQILTRQGWRSHATPILGDSSTLLNALAPHLRDQSDQTIFVYLDPFGLKGCEFDTLKPFLTRSKVYSTELVLNISMPITHRLATSQAVARGSSSNPRIASYHQRLSQVFGGDYWKEIYWSNLGSEEKEMNLMDEYRRRISAYLPFTGSCPVRESRRSRVKYFITFASRHPHAMLLMNDAMCKAYFGQMHQADYEGTLFADTDWTSMRSFSDLETIILETAKTNPGQTRQDLWLTIVQKHFMQFTSSEYKEHVAVLEANGNLSSPTSRPTKRLNDNCLIYYVSGLEHQNP